MSIPINCRVHPVHGLLKTISPVSLWRYVKLRKQHLIDGLVCLDRRSASLDCILPRNSTTCITFRRDTPPLYIMIAVVSLGQLRLHWRVHCCLAAAARSFHRNKRTRHSPFEMGWDLPLCRRQHRHDFRPNCGVACYDQTEKLL